MAKTPKIKKREVSIHSRAARRGEVADGNGVTAKAPMTETEYKPWLHSTQNAGVSKKKKIKQVSRQQKLRQQRALEKADANIDKLERKVADSKARGKKIQARRKDWEELNENNTSKPIAKPEDESMDVGPAVEATPGQGDDAKLPDMEQPLPIRPAETEPRQAEEDRPHTPIVETDEDEVT